MFCDCSYCKTFRDQMEAWKEATRKYMEAPPPSVLDIYRRKYEAHIEDREIEEANKAANAYTAAMQKPDASKPTCCGHPMQKSALQPSKLYCTWCRKYQ